MLLTSSVLWATTDLHQQHTEAQNNKTETETESQKYFFSLQGLTSTVVCNWWILLGLSLTDQQSAVLWKMKNVQLFDLQFPFDGVGNVHASFLTANNGEEGRSLLKIYLELIREGYTSYIALIYLAEQRGAVVKKHRIRMWWCPVEKAQIVHKAMWGTKRWLRAWQELHVKKLPASINPSPCAQLTTAKQNQRKQPAQWTARRRHEAALQLLYLRSKAPMNVQAKSHGRETRVTVLSRCPNVRVSSSFFFNFGEAFTEKCALGPWVLSSQGRGARADCCCAACAPVVEDTVKPERRWCHGPDVKRARWSAALLLFPPTTITHRANREWAQTHADRGTDHTHTGSISPPPSVSVCVCARE